ncbi:hypothetical protein F5878DRAFT_639827 [Lentinula raphanica]|uniref:Uncharacterized protein n=1 Tax=Lentinula raphanica TaxID=153919 RepID=A0AA38PDX0_9AGAR|nr:hypothetical protein F5878DRAFT_639827 [Lentinula raphanica]
MRFASTLFTLCVLGSFAITVTHAAPYVAKENIVPSSRELPLKARNFPQEDRERNFRPDKHAADPDPDDDDEVRHAVQEAALVSAVAPIVTQERRIRAATHASLGLSGNAHNGRLLTTPVQPGTPANGNA